MTGEQIMRDTLVRHPNHHHPRLILSENDFAVFREKRQEGIHKKLLDVVMNHAQKHLDAPLSTYEIPDGIRLLVTSQRVYDRVKELSVAYRVTGEEKYAERAWRELEAAGNFPDWNPKHFLDVAMMCYAFAVGYDWLYSYLSEERRAFLRRAVTEKGLCPVMDDFRDLPRERTYRWYQHIPGDNWKFICDGGVSMAVLAMFDDEENPLYAEILECAFRDSYDAVRRFYGERDGAYVEGLGYWSYGTIHLSFYSLALMSAAGTDYGLTDWVGLRKSAYFVLSMSSPDLISFNFGDAGASNSSTPIFLWFGKLLGDFGIATLRTRMLLDGTVEGGVSDLMFLGDFPESPMRQLPLAFCGDGWDNASFRTDLTPQALYAAIHFGANDVCHGHRDMGTFILNVGDKRFFSDLGADNYNLKPYGATYRYRAEGHNTLVFNHSAGQDQLTQASATTQRTQTQGDSFAIGDMSEAYPGRHAVRGMKMVRSLGGVLLRDEVDCESGDEVRWSAHTRATVTLGADGRSAVLDMDGVKLGAYILSPDSRFTIAHAGTDDYSPLAEAAPTASSPIPKPQDENIGFSKLMITRWGKQHYDICVYFTPLTGEEPQMPQDIPLSRW